MGLKALAVWGILALVSIGLGACQPVRPVTATPATTIAADADDATFDDPFAYCAAVGTLDTPDARYTGPALPDVIAEGLRDAYNADDVALEVFARGSFWRCMEGEVYACHIGANLPCLSKGDLSTTPSAAMADFCTSNLDSDYIPAVVTGRATVFTWRCDGATPVVEEQYTEVDAQGYLSFVWHQLTPPE